MRQKIFAVMGATGHIGRVIVEDLLKRGHKVRALGRNEGKLLQLEHKGAEVIHLDFDDPVALTEAFKDVWALFSMIPPSYTEQSFGDYQDRVSIAICKSLKDSGCKRVVNLSSVGGELADKTGPIKGLHRHEERLNQLENLDLLVHLRPGFFMENLEKYLPMIKSEGVIRSPIDQYLPIAMVATRDIGWKAADFLDSTAPLGHMVFDFMGPKDVTMEHVTEVFAGTFDHPSLWYQQLSMDEAREEMQVQGMQPDLIELMIEMYEGFNSGLIVPTQEIKATHRGITTLEEYAQMVAHKLFSFVG